MDAFFASVEILDNPQLKGLPVVVGGSPQSRGVVCAASYAARKFGIRSAIPCSMAQRLCPEAIFLPPRFERYRELSKMVHEIFRKYTDLIEPVSLDEAWLDVTSNKINSPSATWIAQQLKEDILSETGLVSSAGVSYNKFLAKIASDEDKPNGLFVITPQSAPEFLKNIAIRKIPGVGKVTQKRLQQLDLEVGYQLLAKSEDYLIQHLGKFGHYLFQIIRGIDLRPVVNSYEQKSVGIENTFAEDLGYGDELLGILKELLIGLFKRLQKSEKKGKTLTLKVKFSDFKQITRSVSTSDQYLTEEGIAQIAYQKLEQICLREFPQRKIRLLGVSIANFKGREVKAEPSGQLDFFTYLEQNFPGPLKAESGL